MLDILHAPRAPLLPLSPKNISSTRYPRMMNLRLFVIDQNFAMFSISAWLNIGLMYNSEPAFQARGFLEDDVHFFEGAVGGFGVEKVNGGEDEGVTAGGES